MAAAVLPVTISGGKHTKSSSILSAGSGAFVKTPSFAFQRKARYQTTRKLSIHAQYNDRDSGADFVAGFVLGGAVVGTLGYIFAPQIRRSLLNEEECGFKRAEPQPPNYYDEGLEKTRHTLNEKISQLNSAIDNVSYLLRGANNLPQVPIATDAEESVL